MRTRRSLLLGAAILTGICCGQASADTYPTKPVRWVVAYAAGGGSDALAQRIAKARAARDPRFVIW